MGRVGCWEGEVAVIFVVGASRDSRSAVSSDMMALAVCSLSGPLRSRNSLVLYDSQVAHWFPSQWYLTDDFAEQSLH